MRRRRAGFLLIFGALVPLAVAATAWACGVLATVKVDSVARPGATITVTGANYSSDLTTFTPVEIRWDSRTGPVIGEAIPIGGRINETVQIPRDATSGWHLVNGTQFRKDTGAPKSGTPGRDTLRVQGAAAGAASPWSSGPGGGAGVAVGGDPSGPPLIPTLLGIVLSLGLLGSGLALVARSRAHKANRPLLGA